MSDRSNTVSVSGRRNHARIEAFDIAKLLALICIVVGHSSFAGVPSGIVDFFYSFDMPLFFVVSGYFFKDRDISRRMFEKNVRGLILPYVATCALVVVAMMVRSALFGESVLRAGVVWLVASLYGSGSVTPGMPEGIAAIGALWFLLSLFWSRLLLASFWRAGFPGILSLLAFIVGVSTKDYIWLPFSVQPALCGVLFMYVGQMARDKSILGLGSSEEKKKLNCFLWFVMLMTWLYCGLFFGKLYMVTNTYSHGAIDVIGGICGAFCIIKVSDYASRRLPHLFHLLAKAGACTLPLLCMHLFELNVIRWDLIVEMLKSAGLNPAFPVVISQLAITALLALLLKMAPRKLSGIFY